VKFPIRLGKFKSDKMLAGALGLLLALTLVVAFVAPVSAVPQLAHQFYGTVSIGSVPAPEGTEVVARIAGVTENFTTAVDANHTYGYDPTFYYVLGDDPETPEKEGGNDGDTIEFYVAGTWATNFTFSPGGHNELNLSVEVITNATLEGHVTFPERGAAPNSRWIEDLVVRFFQGGSEMAWSPINATTNNTGVFNITGLNPGTYNVSIKNWTCLSELEVGVALTADNTTVVDFGTTREGDCDNNDIITGADRSLLYSGWGKSEGQAGYNILYDFNRDGSLGGLDRSLMYSNWAQHGDLVS